MNRTLLVCLCAITCIAPLKANAQYQPLCDPSNGNIQVSTPLACPANKGLHTAESCYTVEIHDCSNVDADFLPKINGDPNFIGSAKVNVPPPPVQGVIFLSTGEFSKDFYDDNPSYETFDPNQGGDGNGHFCPTLPYNGWNCGLKVVQDLFNAGYITVQFAFDDFTNPGTEPFGILTGPSTRSVRTESVRYASVVDAITTNVIQTNPPLYSGPTYCATGNSNGANEVAAAITEYGMFLGTTANVHTKFVMVEPTSGPAITYEDLACSSPVNLPAVVVTCDDPDNPTNELVVSPSVGRNAARTIADPSYSGVDDSQSPPSPSDICGYHFYGLDHINPAPYIAQLRDSGVLTDTYSNPSYPIPVKMFLGTEDTTEATAHAQLYYDHFTTTNGAQKSCSWVGGVGHMIPQTYIGASAIVGGLLSSTAGCH